MSGFMPRTVFVCLLALLPQFGWAQSPAIVPKNVDWRAQFTGLDGVSITCIRTIKRKYALRICEKLNSHAAKSLTAAGIPNEIGGTFYSRAPAPKASETFKRPLNLTIHMRSTAANPLGMDIRINASVTYNSAVESTGQTSPRKGELLMWQNGVTGAGSTRRLEKAITKFSQNLMDELLALIGENWSR